MIKGKRLNIIASLDDYKYETFVKACEDKGIVPFNLPRYFDRLGMYLTAIATYGNEDIEDSFRKIAKDRNEYDKELYPDSCCGDDFGKHSHHHCDFICFT